MCLRQIQIDATAIAGLAVITAVIIAGGHDGAPHAWRGAIAGLSYLIAVALLRVWS